MDVKLPFVDDRSYSWMPNCPSWMKTAARRRKLLSRDKETGAERNLREGKRERERERERERRWRWLR
jgi:hypothetical protein